MSWALGPESVSDFAVNVTRLVRAYVKGEDGPSPGAGLYFVVINLGRRGREESSHNPSIADHYILSKLFFPSI